MRLIHLTVENFRCYAEPISVRLDDITALVGRNDVGKSALMDALAIFFEVASPDRDDACKTGNPAQMRISCEFDQLPDELILDADFHTSLAREYCSVWGAPHQQPGSLGISLRSTSIGLEQQMMARSASVFAADEVNHLGRTTREQGERVYDLAFMVSHGVEKERCGDPARLPVQQSFIATSNTSLASHLADQDPGNAQAVLARFMTLPAEASSLGVFDTLPRGYYTSLSAIEALQDDLAENHGVAADTFLAKLACARKTDEAALKAKIARYRDAFVKSAQVDPSDRAVTRRVRSTAMIYAAGRLAKEWKVLPLKNLKKILLEFHRRSTNASAETLLTATLRPLERVQAYVEAHQGKLRDLDKHKLKQMSGKKLDRHPGFLKTIKHQRCLLVRSKQWARLFGSSAHWMLKELQTEGLLYSTSGLQMQMKVRANSAKDRVYCITLD